MSSGAHRKLRRHLAAGPDGGGKQPANRAEAAKPAPACHVGAQAGGHRPASPHRRAESFQCPREQDWPPGVHSGRACCTRDRCCSSLLPQHGEGGRESQGTLRWLLPCAPDQSPRFGGPGPEHVHLTPGHRPGTGPQTAAAGSDLTPLLAPHPGSQGWGGQCARDSRPGRWPCRGREQLAGPGPRSSAQCGFLAAEPAGRVGRAGKSSEDRRRLHFALKLPDAAASRLTELLPFPPRAPWPDPHPCLPSSRREESPNAPTQASSQI